MAPTACTVNKGIDDTQFQCIDTPVCPSGFVCKEGVCQKGTDTGIDGSVLGRVDDGLVAFYAFNQVPSDIEITDTAGFFDAPATLEATDVACLDWQGQERLSIALAGACSGTSLFTEEPVLNRSLIASVAFTIEAWVTPSELNVPASAQARVVSVSNNTMSRNVSLVVESSPEPHWAVWLRTGTLADSSDANGLAWQSPEFPYVPGDLVHTVAAFNDGIFRFCATSGSAELNCQQRSVDLDISAWEWSMGFTLAGENALPTGAEPADDGFWQGTFHLVAIYNRALSAAEIEQNWRAGPDAN